MRWIQFQQVCIGKHRKRSPPEHGFIGAAVDLRITVISTRFLPLLFTVRFLLHQIPRRSEWDCPALPVLLP